MKGPIVPLVLVPRFTSWVGADTYETAPLDVAAYETAKVTFWRGPLLGTNGTAATFSAYFEVSHDAQTWFSAYTVITTTDTVDQYDLPLSRRWLRLRVVLTPDDDDVAAISAWCSGTLLERIPA